jgi:hypothetical protein
LKKQTLKPGFHHFIGARVETGAVSGCGPAGFAACTAPHLGAEFLLEERAPIADA